MLATGIRGAATLLVRVSGGESLADFVNSLGTPMPSFTVSAVDIETDAGSRLALATPFLLVIR